MKKRSIRLILVLLSLCMCFGLCACGDKEDDPQNTQSVDTGNTENEYAKLLLSNLPSFQIVRSDSMKNNSLKLLLSFAEVLRAQGQAPDLAVVSDFTVVYPVQANEIVVGKTTREGSEYTLDGAKELAEGEYDFQIAGTRLIFRYTNDQSLMEGLEALLLTVFSNVEANTIKSDYALALYNRDISRYDGFYLNNQFQDGMHLNITKNIPCFGVGQAGYPVTVQQMKDDAVLKEQTVTIAENGSWQLNLEPTTEANRLRINYNNVMVKNYNNVQFVNNVFSKPTNGMKVLINGQEVDVVETPAGIQVIASLPNAEAKEMEIEVIRTKNVEDCFIRPLSKNIDPVVSGKSVKFKVTSFPIKLSVEFDVDATEHLQFFLYDYEEIDFASMGKGFRYYAPGEYWEKDNMDLASGDTVYLAEGARLNARFAVKDKENITIAGRGVIDTFGFEVETRMLSFENCKNVTLQDYLLTGPRSWMNVLVNCDVVNIKNISVIGTNVNSDGIDIVGSRDVTIDGCFFRTNDDCIAIKSWGPDVNNIRITNCVFWDMIYGNGIEIGYETRCDNISNITIENNDVIRVEKGCTLSIHLGDHAHVSGIKYKDIRVEEAYGKAIEMFIKKHDKYSLDEERGQISNVEINGVHYVGGTFGKVIFQGFDSEHMIKDVTIQNVTYFGKTIGKENLNLSTNTFIKNITWNDVLLSAT